MTLYDHECDPCKFEKERVKANGFCRICAEYLCAECVKNHKKSKLTREHKLLTGGNVPEDAKALQIIANAVACTEHPNKEVSHFCGNHQIHICEKCCGQTHRNCKKRTKLSTMIKPKMDKTSLTESQTKIRTLRDVNVKEKERKAEDLRYMHTEQRYIEEGRCCLARELYEHLIANSCKSAEEVVAIIRKKMATMEKEIAAIETFETECTNDIELIEAVLEYGSEKQIHIVGLQFNSKLKLTAHAISCRQPELILNGSDDAEAAYYAKENASQVATSDKKDDETATATSMKAKINTSSQSQVTKTERRGRGARDSTKTEAKKAEDAVRQVGENVQYIQPVYIVADNKGNHCHCAATAPSMPASPMSSQMSLISRNVEYVNKHRVSGRGDRSICSILAMATLPDSRFVFIDNTNDKMKVYTPNLDFMFCLRLDFNPSDMCHLESNIVAIVGENAVNRYKIGAHDITFTGGFPTKLSCIAVSKYGQNIAILLRDEFVCGRAYDVEIRHPINGKIFASGYFDNLPFCSLPNCPNSLLISKKHGFLIGDQDSRLRCFDANAREKWYYKGSRNARLQDALGIAEDRDGNIYVCGRHSNNIHQISRKNFMDNRVIISDLPGAQTVVVDDRTQRIVVGCQMDDYVYVFKFM